MRPGRHCAGSGIWTTRQVATTTAFARTNLISVSAILGYFGYSWQPKSLLFFIYFHNFLTTRRLLLVATISNLLYYILIYNCTKVGAFIHICTIVQLIERTTLTNSGTVGRSIGHCGRLSHSPAGFLTQYRT